MLGSSLLISSVGVFEDNQLTRVRGKRKTKNKLTFWGLNPHAVVNVWFLEGNCVRWEKNDLVSLSLLAVLICAQGFSFHIESESKVTVQNNYVYISCHLVILTLHSLSFSFSLPPLHLLPLLLSLSLSLVFYQRALKTEL